MFQPPEYHVEVPAVVDRAFSTGALSVARGSGAPSVVLRRDGRRVLWANEAAATLLEARSVDVLERRLADARPPLAGQRRDAVARPAAPRLERIRVTIGTRIQNLTALCARDETIEGLAIIALAFIGPDAEAASRDVVWSSGMQGVAPLSADRDPDPASPGPADRVEHAEATDGDRLGDSAARLRAVLGGASACRFAWSTDALGTITRIDEPLLRELGLPLCQGSQAGLTEQVSTFDPVGAARLRASLDSGATWSGVTVKAPVLDGRVSVPVLFAGTPLFDARRQHVGFKGFCRFDVADLDLRIASAPAVASDHLRLEVTAVPEAPEASATPVGIERAPDPGFEPHVTMEASGSAEDGRGDDRTGNGYDRAANVVRLRPVHPASPPRLPSPVKVPPGVEDDAAPSVSADDPRVRTDGAVARGAERPPMLTSSEQQAFQDIGRALGPGPRRPTLAAGLPVPAAGTPTASIEADPSRGSESDLDRHAAALVDHMSAGLLVLRQRRVLFANEALRQALQFESHDELLDALALRFTRHPPLDADAGPTTLRLPSSYGDDVAFGATPRTIAWNGKPAQLWTIAQADGSAPSDDGDAQAGLPDAADVLDITTESIAIADVNGRLLWLNKQAERCIGRARAGLAGEEFALMLAPESRAGAITAFEQLAADPNPHAETRTECFARCGDGATGPAEMRLTKLGGGERIGIVWRDLSSLRLLERDAAQAKRQAVRAGNQQPEFLATVSHQVRTPLNAILGFAEIMMDERFGPLGNSRYKDYLKDIHTSGTQVITLIDDLMDLSRIEAGRLDLQLGPVDINKVIVDCVADAHALAHRERVIVRTSFGPRLPRALADERSARQIVGNLLSNAIKFNEPGGQVIVSTAVGEGGSVMVRIRDTGIGMSDSDIAAALEPFRQLAPTKNASGTGLGLPLTKALVGANGASLSMRSRPTEGTMVEVTFQATMSAPARVPA